MGHSTENMDGLYAHTSIEFGENTNDQVVPNQEQIELFFSMTDEEYGQLLEEQRSRDNMENPPPAKTKVPAPV